ncbi:MAG TPA: hypothetical protein VD994_06605 [Prosthecobacter sp.]|nr:hypothetical protein [Prosthecobacter sp.]
MIPGFNSAPAPELLPWLSIPLITFTAIFWVWWVRRGLDHSRKVHCRDCHYRGHPRIKSFPIRGSVSICPDCGGESLIPVRPRAWLHHQEANPLTPLIDQAVKQASG